MTKKYLIIGAVLLAITGVVWVSMSRFNFFPQLIATTVTPQAAETFPNITTENLTDIQRAIADILRAEYAEQPSGTKYSEGVTEPWCADFVSWVYHEAGVPLANPHSGSWRIPGTYTLREYYESTGTFRPADSDYTPKLGDTMLYDNPNQFGQHVNIVLTVDGDTITTIGGNEIGKIRVLTHRAHHSSGFIGYGVL